MGTRMVRADEKVLDEVSKKCEKKGLIMAWLVTDLLKKWLKREGK